MKRTNIILAAALAMILASCGGSNKQPDCFSKTIKVTKSEVGEDWNLKGIEEGTFMTVGPLCNLVFEAPNGDRYAVNGTAKSNTPYPDFDEIFEVDENGLKPSTLFDYGSPLIKDCSDCQTANLK
jgi:hypothetical protein